MGGVFLLQYGIVLLLLLVILRLSGKLGENSSPKAVPWCNMNSCQRL